MWIAPAITASRASTSLWACRYGTCCATRSSRRGRWRKREDQLGLDPELDPAGRGAGGLGNLRARRDAPALLVVPERDRRSAVGAGGQRRAFGSAGGQPYRVSTGFVLGT